MHGGEKSSLLPFSPAFIHETVLLPQDNLEEGMSRDRMSFRRPRTARCLAKVSGLWGKKGARRRTYEDAPYPGSLTSEAESYIAFRPIFES